MYNQGEIETKERRKVVFFAGATVAVILALIVAIVVVATNKANQGGDTLVGNGDKSDFTLEINSSDSESSANDSSSLLGSLTTNAAEDDEPEAPAFEATNLPETGAADLLPVALMLGVLTTAATATAMRRQA